MAAAGGGGGRPPAASSCAACRYQRRRCKEDCPLAPYFPHDQPRVFRNAHRLFGINKILQTLALAGGDPEKRHEAMQCVVYESQAWDLYPSAGCVPIIAGLQDRLQQAEHELRRVRADLEACRRRAAAASAQGIADASDNAAAAVTSNDGNMPQTLPWTTILQPPQYEHPFFVNATTMMVPQLYDGQHQPVVASNQLPELQHDMMNYSYFADGINGENDEMPRQSAARILRFKDNNGFINQDIDSSSTLPAAANKS